MADDCGIGTPQGHQGPCSGTLYPSDAGKGAFDGISASPVASALIAAGALVAVVLFALFLAHAVCGFFGRKRKCAWGRGKKFSTVVKEHMRDHPETDAFSTVVEDHMRERAERGDENDLDGYSDDERELDREDDMESEIDEAEWETDAPGYTRKFE